MRKHFPFGGTRKCLKRNTSLKRWFTRRFYPNDATCGLTVCSPEVTWSVPAPAAAEDTPILDLYCSDTTSDGTKMDDVQKLPPGGEM